MDKNLEKIKSLYFKFVKGDYVDTYDKNGEIIPELCGRIIDYSVINGGFPLRIRSHTTEQIHGIGQFIDRICKVSEMLLMEYWDIQEDFKKIYKEKGIEALKYQQIEKIDIKGNDTFIHLDNHCIFFISTYDEYGETVTTHKLLSCYGDEM